MFKQYEPLVEKSKTQFGELNSRGNIITVTNAISLD